MKKVISLVLAVVFVLVLAPVAFAHSGGTDSRGGHTNRSTGEYHYHHGYSAHQHEDLDGDGDLDCPYDFVDKTGQNSGSTYRSSYSSNTPAPVYTPRATSSPHPTVKDRATNKRDVLDAILIGISTFAIPFGIAFSVRIALDKKQKKQEEAERKRKEHEQWLAEKAEYTKQYGGKPLLELVCAPNYCFIADDGLPAASGTERWGYGYTFYASYSGRAFHKSTCRYAQGCPPKNAYSLYKWSDKHPCSYCRPKLPDLSWYEEYRRIKAIKEKYGID